MSEELNVKSGLPSVESAPLTSLPLEQFLPYQLNVLATEVSQALAQVYGAKFGISIPQWRIMATLGQFHSLTARDVGSHSRMHKTTVSRAVGELEKRKLVQRRTNKSDMREAFLTLSEDGLAMYREIVPLACRFSDALCLDLDAKDLDALQNLLARLRERSAVLSAHA